VNETLFTNLANDMLVVHYEADCLTLLLSLRNLCAVKPWQLSELRPVFALFLVLSFLFELGSLADAANT
jgi:hypothetical protein